jgi:glyoxylase-like metal-dependent hydrolase (beta-lactamase superfamily II)
MQAIAENIYIEDQYLGVTVGAINLPRGLIQVDAPPAPEDGRAWRAALLNLGGGTERLLINLDAHPDRTLGVRTMECTVIAQEKAAAVFRNRPSTFKAQGDETGADWEGVPGLSNMRWAPPEISFSHEAKIYWNDTPILLEHHPGPSVGAAWVILPEAKVVFVGDTVVRNQPPFLAGADLPVWIEAVKLLLSPAYRGWLVVGGRGGLAAVEVIRAQLEFLQQINTKLDKLAAKKSAPDALESLIPLLLAGFKIPSHRQRQYNQRLHYGLYHYYTRHYRPPNLPGEE